MPPASATRAWFAKLALATISLLVTALLGEVALRLAWDAPILPKPMPLPANLQNLPVLRTISELSAPNVRGMNSGVLFETNSHGFRGPERSLAKPQGTIRVMLIGDSISMGSGVAYESTYGHLLELRLNTQPAGRAYEVLNWAVSGLYTKVILGRFERLGLRFDPDLVIYGYTLNDIEGEHYIRSYENRYHPFFFARSPIYLVRFFGPRARELFQAVFATSGSYVGELHENYFENEAAWAEVLAGFDRLANQARESRICAVLFVHTDLNMLNFLHPFRAEYDQIADAAAARGLFVIRSYERLLEKDPTQLWVGLADPHPNEAGHQLLEEALWAGLQQLPTHCWRGARRSPNTIDQG